MQRPRWPCCLQKTRSEKWQSRLKTITFRNIQVHPPIRPFASDCCCRCCRDCRNDTVLDRHDNYANCIANQWDHHLQALLSTSNDDFGAAVAIAQYLVMGIPHSCGRAILWDRQWLSVAKIYDRSNPNNDCFRDIAFGRLVSLDDSGSIVPVGIPGTRYTRPLLFHRNMVFLD